MGTAETNSEREEQEKGFYGRARGIGKEVIAATCKYSAISVFVILLSLGLTTLYDITIGDDVPGVRRLSSFSPEKSLILKTPYHHLTYDWDESQCWEALQEPLQILDRVCPEASHWVRNRYESGHLIWEEEYSGAYAKFHYIDRDLTVNRILFGENNGVVASILAHEFRHSRQNFSKFFRATVACSILREPNDSIVETEAELFEKEVLLAIFG